MKKCPYCAEEIQDAAVVCKHCGRDLKGGASQVQLVQPKKKTGAAAWGCLTIIVLFAVLVIAGQCGTRPIPSSTTRQPTTPSGPAVNELALLSSTGGHSSESYMAVEGQVENISGSALKSVAAVATWYDNDDKFIKSDSALIEYDPILPGQKSPFKVLTRANPAMKKYSVTFKRILGGTIGTEDRRKK